MADSKMRLDQLLEELCDAAASFYERGYAYGSTGNLSLRAGEQVWITPTGVSLRNLRPVSLACVMLGGEAVNEIAPSKEVGFHLAAYRAAGDRARALVHLHSTYAVALSCLAELNEREPLPPITPYYWMRVAPVAVVPYFRPGSAELAAAIGEAAVLHDSILLRHHGLVCLGATLAEAVDRAEEFEQTARHFFILRGHELRALSPEQLEDLERVFRNSRSARN